MASNIMVHEGKVVTHGLKPFTDANGIECCCGGCCRCVHSGSTCCYHPDDVLTLRIQQSWSTLRHCPGDRCDTSSALTCTDCVNYDDSETYHLFLCDGTTLLWEIDTPNSCFPTYIYRECGTGEWLFFDDALNTIATDDLPLCAQCVEDCTFDPMLCASIDPCDLTLTCVLSGSDISDPPPPYSTCTHDDGQAVGGSGFCFCAGSTCYTFDYKGAFPVCVKDENGGVCLGTGTELQIVKTLTVDFDIVQHCEDDGGTCRLIEN